MNARLLVIPRRTLRTAVVAGAVVLAVILAVMSGALTDLGAPRATADQTTLAAQRTAAERAIGRAYDRATDVLKRSHDLKLAITPQQAAAIESKTVADLRTLRRNALQSVADSYGMRGSDAQRYVADAENRLDVPQVGTDAGVLLAPRLLVIVTQMDDVATRLTDNAARQLTNPFPNATPTPSPTK